MENNQTQGERFYQDAKQRYEQRKVDPMRPLLSPEKLWLNVDEVNRRLKSYPRITFKAEKVRSSVRRKIYLLPLYRGDHSIPAKRTIGAITPIY